MAARSVKKAAGDGGVWIDTDTGDVVTAEPVNGRLLVVPGDDVPEHISVLVSPPKTDAS